MVVLASGSKLTVEDIPLEIAGSQVSGSTFKEPETGNLQPETSNLQPETLSANERAQILAALERCRGNKSKAADELGISRRTIHRKLKEWGLA